MGLLAVLAALGGVVTTLHSGAAPAVPARQVPPASARGIAGIAGTPSLPAPPRPSAPVAPAQSADSKERGAAHVRYAPRRTSPKVAPSLDVCPSDRAADQTDDCTRQATDSSARSARTIRRDRQTSREARASAGEHPALATPPADSGRASPAAPAVVPVAEASATSSASRPSASVQSVRGSPPQEALDEEVLQLRRAYDLLRAHEPLRAWSALSEHARRFPAGKLGEMREVARMIALCQLGQATRARQRAARFLADHPGSTYAPRVRSICAERAE